MTTSYITPAGDDFPSFMQTHYYSDDPSLLRVLPYPAPAQHYAPAPVSQGTASFLDGSPPASYADHEYPYFFDRGGPSTNTLSSSSPLPAATGLSESGDPSRLRHAYAEDVLSYHHWNLPSPHGHPRLPESADFSFKSAPSYSGPPPVKLPTPSEMAILMSTSRVSSEDIPAIIPPTPLAIASTAAAPPPEEEFTLARERKHACSMCHKRFDRPSTLRKHLLVHTGEKAFQCKTCGRRFGVASNLNRHVRRCILKPVNTMHSSPVDSSPEPAAAAAGAASHDSSPRPSRAQSASQSLKRRRRAPSPSRWIPDSLRGFILEGLQKTALIPLPPVKPSAVEERNSWDENVGNAPYHPREWVFKPQLPGPGVKSFIFGGRDVGNFGGGGGSREQMLGRVMVF